MADRSWSLWQNKTQGILIPLMPLTSGIMLEANVNGPLLLPATRFTHPQETQKVAFLNLDISTTTQ
jgi:hypothetical protein